MRTLVREFTLAFHQKILDDQYHRYRSWEHCYTYFQSLHSGNNQRSMDTATLHLAFYLASWGMYRGSSQLLQKDYTIHTRVVQELLDEKYESLWQLNFSTIEAQGSESTLIFQLVERLRHIYAELRISPTYILVTKVLLGTFCCMPAYDNFFIDGVTYWNKALPDEFKPKFPAHFSKNSYRGLISFYREHKEEFDEAQDEIANYGIEYPAMKLVDMYFWTLGQLAERLNEKRDLIRLVMLNQAKDLPTWT